MSVLARPSDPTAIFGWCELPPKTFDHYGFLLFSVREYLEQRQHPVSGLMAVLSSSTLRAVHSGHLSVATRHTGHDRFIASRSAWLSQTMPPLFTELRTYRMTLRYARRSLRVFVTRHTRSGRSCPCQIKHRVQILVGSALFYCVFLCRSSRNKARSRQ